MMNYRKNGVVTEFLETIYSKTISSEKENNNADFLSNCRRRLQNDLSWWICYKTPSFKKLIFV